MCGVADELLTYLSVFTVFSMLPTQWKRGRLETRPRKSQEGSLVPSVCFYLVGHTPSHHQCMHALVPRWCHTVLSDTCTGGGQINGNTWHHGYYPRHQGYRAQGLYIHVYTLPDHYKLYGNVTVAVDRKLNSMYEVKNSTLFVVGAVRKDNIL